MVIKAQMELTDGGIINLDLFSDIAPLSVANFVELINKGYYNGLCFHRVIPGFMVQGGGFTASKKGLEEAASTKTIKGEFRSNGVANTLSHTPGVLSMARTNVKDSASSQFFICVDNAAFLDGEYAAFGKTSDDASLAKAIEISKVKTTTVGYYGDVPVAPIVIKSMKIVGENI